MPNLPNVVIIFSRCCRSGKSFGVRFEEMETNRWVADWAFSVNERSASNEGYDRNQIEGFFNFAREYPGCPHCEAKNLFKCSCEKVACWDGRSLSEKCPWCGASVQIRGSVSRLFYEKDR